MSRGLSIEDTAGRLSLSAEQVRDLIAAGALATIDEEGGERVTPESVLIYMSSRLTADLKRLNAPRPSALSVLGDVLLPLLLVTWYLAACVEIFSLRDHKPIVPWPVALGVLALGLAAAWALGRRSTSFSTVKGMGTTLYGARMTPSGRVGTEYLVFAMVPILPIRSYVILEASAEEVNWSGTIRSRSYHLRNLDGIHWPQAAPVLAGVWAASAALVALALLA